MIIIRFLIKNSGIEVVRQEVNRFIFYGKSSITVAAIITCLLYHKPPLPIRDSITQVVMNKYPA